MTAHHPLTPRTLAGAVALGLLFTATPIARQGGLQLGVAMRDATLSPGEALTMGVTVNNPGIGAVADFYFAILLPDGSTIVSAGPGIGARFGHFGDLRTLVPVATGISLGSPFTYRNDTFFSYRFTGTEPPGTYRVYFAALSAGALGDGVIGGGELLALTTTEFTVGPPVTSVVDPSRRVTALMPVAGGSLTSTAADGTAYELQVPAGALAAPTSLSLTPIVSAANLPGDGTFALGVRAEPSGLVFPVPLRLVITLPAGVPLSQDGYAAIVTSDEGRRTQSVPVLAEGRTLSLTVPHFSDAVVIDSVFWFCQDYASAAMEDACETLRAAYAVSGGFDNDTFRQVATFELGNWFTTGLGPRVELAATNPPPAGSDPDAALDTAYLELLTWGAVYRAAFGPMEVGNTGRPLAGIVGQLFANLVFATSYAQDRVNVRCLADKSGVGEYIDRFYALETYWETAFGMPVQSPTSFCLDLGIDAAPPPVLSPGITTSMPIAIVARFSDGEELANELVSLTITATNATVETVLGNVRTPVFGPVQIRPTATTSTIVITGAFIETDLNLLPIRSRTFNAGSPSGEVIIRPDSYLRAVSRADIPGLSPLVRTVLSPPFSQAQEVSAVLSTTVTSNGAIYTINTTSQASRSVSAAGGVVTIAGTGSKRPGLSITNRTGVDGFPASYGAEGITDNVCFDLPRPYTATYNVTSNGPAPPQPGTAYGQVILRGLGSDIVHPGGGVTITGSHPLNAGASCVTVITGRWQCRANAGDNEVDCWTPTTLQWSYTVALSPR